MQLSSVKSRQKTHMMRFMNVYRNHSACHTALLTMRSDSVAHAIRRHSSPVHCNGSSIQWPGCVQRTSITNVPHHRLHTRKEGMLAQPRGGTQVPLALRLAHSVYYS